jgi:bacteriocin biosynthesis cyclodehydratase domain-containing protein
MNSTIDSDNYVFRPDVRVVVHDPDTVELRTGVWNTDSVTLRDEDGKGVLAELVLALADGATVRDLRGRRGVAASALTDVVEALLANDVLRLTGPDARGMTSPTAAQTLGMGARDRVRPESTILLAPDELANLFGPALGAEYTGAVSRADSALVASLLARDLFLDTDGLATSDAAANFLSWKESAVVVLWPELHPFLLGNLNRLSHEVGFRLVPAVVDGPFGIIGPVVLPGLTPCFACAESRVLDTMRDSALYVRYREALARGQVHTPQGDAWHPMMAVVAAFAAWETDSLLRFGIGFTAGKLFTLYAPTMEMMFHELVTVPGCPVCAPPSGLDTPLYADLQGYVAAHLGSPDEDGSR